MELVDEREELERTASPGHLGRVTGTLRRHGRLLVVVLAVLALTVGVWGLRWWTHPDVFGAGVGVGSFSAAPQPVATSRLTFGVLLPPGDGSRTTVTFRGTPVMNFATNTARATATFSVCHRPPEPQGTFIGISKGLGNHECTRLDPIVAGTTLRYPSPAEYVIATITPTRPGKVLATGADFDYSLDRSGWYRRGNDHVDLSIGIRATAGTR